MLRQDVDRLFSYNTKQQVQIGDRLLGITNYVIMFVVMVYIVGYVFIQDHGYLEKEPAKGVAVVQFSGEDLAWNSVGDTHSRFFSEGEITFPGLENGNLFVATKVHIQQEERGVCEDENKPCLTAEDCSPGVGAKCSPNKFCVEPSWCPVGEHEEYKLRTDNGHIWVKSGITFRHLDHDKMFSTDMSQIIMYPNAHHNTYTVRDFLQQCDPPVRFEEVGELGAAIEVQFVWNCQVDSLLPCDKVVGARRVDNLLDEDHIGYGFNHVEYDVANPDKRTNYKKWGIRFFFGTLGVGSKLSMAMIIFRISTGMALVGFAPIIADIIMTQCLRMSKKYHARKYDYTQDFSDYFDDKTGGDITQGLKEDMFGQGEEDEYDDEADEIDFEWRQRFEMDEA